MYEERNEAGIPTLPTKLNFVQLIDSYPPFISFLEVIMEMEQEQKDVMMGSVKVGKYKKIQEKSRSSSTSLFIQA